MSASSALFSVLPLYRFNKNRMSNKRISNEYNGMEKEDNNKQA